MYNNLKDIPSFPDRTWHSQMSPLFFKEWINGDYSLNLDTPYQRNYVWTPYQKSSYLEYLLQGGMYGRDIHLNGRGFSAGRLCVLDCLDGKQRISTLFDFLDDKVPVFGKTLSQYEDERFLCLWHIMNINVYELSEKEAVNFYISLNRGGTQHTEEDMKKAYDYRNKFK